MFDLTDIARELGIGTDEVTERMEESLTVMQVWFAELEDAVAMKEYVTIRKAAHQIALEAEALHLYTIIRQTEQIELLATFGRDTDYTSLLGELHHTLYDLYETFTLQRETLAG